MPPSAARLQPVSSAEEWDRSLASLPAPHFLQSSAWASFKGDYGWRAEPYRLLVASDTLGYASVLTRNLLGPLRVAYVPRGPLLQNPDPAGLELALAALEELSRQRGWLMLKVDPEIWDEAVPPVRALLRRRSWRPGDQVQFRNTVDLGISGDEDTLLSQMKPKTRYNIRLAGRREVTVEETPAEALGAVYDLYRETGVRDGFIVRPRSYYLSLWSGLVGAGMGVVLVARHQGTPVAALIAVAFGNTAWYFHGASRYESRQLMATYLLQWEAIRWARARGCTRYDLWGAPESLDENDPMSGVLRFKLGFGGSFREGLGAWDYAPRPYLYRAYHLVVPRLLALGRAARRRTQQYG